MPSLPTLGTTAGSQIQRILDFSKVGFDEPLEFRRLPGLFGIGKRRGNVRLRYGRVIVLRGTTGDLAGYISMA